jgi:hypothetical protein
VCVQAGNLLSRPVAGDETRNLLFVGALHRELAAQYSPAREPP